MARSLESESEDLCRIAVFALKDIMVCLPIVIAKGPVKIIKLIRKVNKLIWFPTI